MSAVAIVCKLLKSVPALTALVPATKIYAGYVPQGTVLPAIGVAEISANEEWTTRRRTATTMVRARVQVTVYTKENYALMKDLLLLCKLGGSVHTGEITTAPGKTYAVNSVLPWGVGPEIPPADDKIYEQSRDFMVTFAEAN